MRKMEVVVPHDILPDITKSIHEKDFSFVVVPYDDENVTVQIEYDKGSEREITELEEELNQQIDDFNEDNG